MSARPESAHREPFGGAAVLPGVLPEALPAPAAGQLRRFGRSGASSTWYVVACALWLLAYLLPGIVGHEPWKQDETYTFGIVHHFLLSHDWLIPINAGQPFMEKPPLFMWTASAFAWLLHPLLPLHDAARFATFFYAALTLGFTARAAACVPFAGSPAAANVDAGTSMRRLAIPAAVALLGSTTLVLKHLHDLFSDVSLMAGTAIGVAALCRIAQTCGSAAAAAAAAAPLDAEIAQIGATRRILRVEGMLLGLGVGIAFLSKGVFVPGIFLLTALALPACYRGCRSRRYWASIGIALASSAPFVLIWPTLLYRASPDLFMVWFWDNNVGRFLGFSVAQLGSDNEPGLIWKALLGACFPVGPLALIGLAAGGWRRLRTPALGVATLFAALGLLTLGQSATVRQLYLLPFTVPGALLAADALQRLMIAAPRGRLVGGLAHGLQRAATGGWDIASRVLFGAFAALAWFVWLARTWGSARGLIGTPADAHGTASPGADAAGSLLQHIAQRCVDATQWLGRWLPLDFPLAVHPVGLLGALCLTAGWWVLMRRLHRAGPWRGVLSWCAGLTLAWGLVNTLLLPWLDRAKGYGPVYQTLAARWEQDWPTGDCIASVRLGESEAPMLAYFTGRTAQPVEGAQALSASSCRWVIVQSPAQLPALVDSADAATMEGTHAPHRWQAYWDGARQGDTHERLTVYRDIASKVTNTPDATASAALAGPSSGR